MKNNTNNVQDAISDLAALRPNWTLLADTLPAEFLQQVKGEIESLAAQRDALSAQLAALKKRVADAERGIVEHYQDPHGDHIPCVACEYPAGVKVALVRLEDGEN